MKSCPSCKDFVVNPERPNEGRCCMASPEDFDKCFDRFYAEMVEIRKTMTDEQWKDVT